ncbi:17231_t:CDS:2 [Acaulospora morrowiae]|uniref:17231_t:CDS:1 n=1 Tax=Acaulospora morrowiae TaxID=94023 RepID=A0A9N9EZI4_9GLOM|nr:17231_t:CDS:2 [Acaulospora morrowiae]
MPRRVTKKLKHKNKTPIYKANDGSEHTPTKEAVEVSIHHAKNPEPDDSEFTEEIDYRPRKRVRRKYPVRSTTIEHEHNYSEKLYYEKFDSAFNDRVEVTTSEKRASKKVSPDLHSGSSHRRFPKRKSSRKNIDYSVKRYYEKFESAMKTKIYNKNSRGIKGKTESTDDLNNDRINETEEPNESDDSSKK